MMIIIIIMISVSQVEHTNAERSIMEKVDHPFVVGLKCAFQTTHKLYMVMDFVQGGDMYTHLSRRGALRSSLVQLFTAEIVLALQVCVRVYVCVVRVWYLALYLSLCACGELCTSECGSECGASASARARARE